MRYYYKRKDNKGYLNLKSPLTDLTNHTEITEAEYNELIVEQKAKIEKAIQERARVT